MKDKIPVAILGATGAVGQRFVQVLAGHPWFEIAALAASTRSAGRPYGEACHSILPGDLPDQIRAMPVLPLEPDIPGKIVFSALPATVAREVEPQFAAAGYAICSNASAFRDDPDVPLVIPEVNPDHLALIPRQRKTRGTSGFIVTNPNCSTSGIAMALKPLHDAFGVEAVVAVTMQAVSGAGYPGVPALDIIGNVLPYIPEEEEKIAREARLLLGAVQNGAQVPADFRLSAHANRVPVIDGHTICLSIGLRKHPELAHVRAILRDFRAPDTVAALPSAPARPITLRNEDDRPQPRRDCEAEAGMTVTVGRVRPDQIFDVRMVVLVHNTLRGAAGGAVLNGELLVAQGYVS